MSKEFRNTHTLTIPETYREMIEVTIEGDVNDGDYISETTMLSLEEFEEYFEAFLTVLANEGQVDHNWDSECQESEFDWGALLDGDAGSVVPYGEYGCHTIEIESIYYHDENGGRWMLDLKRSM